MCRIIKRLTAGIPLMAALLLTACGEGAGDRLPMLQATAHRLVPLTKETESPKCEVSLKVDYVAGNDAVAKAINNAIGERLFYLTGLSMQEMTDSFANQYVRNYVKDFGPLYREDRTDSTRCAWYEYRYTLTTETRQELPKRLTYIINLDYYEGGAHGISQQLVMNFNTENGERLTLGDMLTEGYEQRLQPLLLKALMEKVKAGSEEQLREMGYLTAMDIFVPENFILQDDGITFIYNPYEIAPYAMGRTELTLDYGELGAKE